jgi:TPR repeat protein
MAFTKIGSLQKSFDKEVDKYVSREFQQYGYELAEELNDRSHISLYIKLAKETPRGLLESARAFVKDAPNVQSRGRLYMWKLKQLKAALPKK